MNNFLYIETDAEGNEKERPRLIHYSEMRTAVRLRCPRIDDKKLRRLLEIACTTPGYPVDLTHFEKGALVYSARIKWQGTKLDQSAILLPS